MWIQTTFGTYVTATAGDLDRELRDLQRYLDPQDPGFVRIRASASGPELELTTVQLRLRREGRVLLGTLPAPLRELLHDFATGKAGWDTEIEWTDVTPLPWRRRMVPYLVAIVVAGALLAALVAVLLNRAGGTSP